MPIAGPEARRIGHVAGAALLLVGRQQWDAGAMRPSLDAGPDAVTRRPTTPAYVIRPSATRRSPPTVDHLPQPSQLIAGRLDQPDLRVVDETRVARFGKLQRRRRPFGRFRGPAER